jgi:hypothetical protein
MLPRNRYRDLRKSEGTAEIPALSEGQFFLYVVALASESSTVRVLSDMKKLMSVADSSCARIIDYLEDAQIVKPGGSRRSQQLQENSEV